MGNLGGNSEKRLRKSLRLNRKPVRERWLAWVEVIQLLAAARADGRGQHINWPRVEMLSRFGGIRIEDDLAVTRSGT